MISALASALAGELGDTRMNVHSFPSGTPLATHDGQLVLLPEEVVEAGPDPNAS